MRWTARVGSSWSRGSARIEQRVRDLGERALRGAPEADTATSAERFLTASLQTARLSSLLTPIPCSYVVSLIWFDLGDLLRGR